MIINKITYAGHSAIFLSSDTKVIAIDPWLAGNPACPESLQNPAKLDLIVLTHGHADHAGDAIRLAKLTGAKIAATYELAMLMIQGGVNQDKVIPMNKGGTVSEAEIKISLTHAMHSSSFDTEAGTVYAGEACGVVIQDQKNTYYHAGDTALFSDMLLIREQYNPNIAFLPIGDRFTMGPKEAAKAAKIIGAKYLIPVHYKTFGLLTGTLAEFITECAEQTPNAKVIGLNSGDSFSPEKM